MRATALNHVSIPAVDVEKSVAFYQEVFGMEQFLRRTSAWPSAGCASETFSSTCFRSMTLPVAPTSTSGSRSTISGRVPAPEGARIFDDSERFSSLWELPGGEVQMYFRDPADNFVEIDWPDVATLDRSVFGADLKVLADDLPQDDENRKARLFLGRLESG